MKAEEKAAAAALINLAADWALGGYRKEARNYNFTDDPEAAEGTGANAEAASLDTETSVTLLCEGVDNPLVLLIAETMNDEAKAMLDKMLSAINLSINTNTHIIEFRSESGNSANIAKAIAEKIKSLNPKHILCAGEAASTLFSPPHSPLATPHSLYTMYHPKELLADASLKRPAWEDLKKIRSALGV